jgi:O-antigen ligase
MVNPKTQSGQTNMRRFLVICLSIVLFLGSLTFVWVSHATRDYMLRGYANPTTDKNLPFRTAILGVNADLRQFNAEELSKQLDLMTQANITWVRQFVYWDEVQPTEDTFVWDSYDTIFETFQEYPSLKPVVVLMNTPQWAISEQYPYSSTLPPHNLESYARFVATFTQRYQSSIDYYQIWDEPNLYNAWGQTDPRVSEYAALLQVAYDTIHAHDPAASVIAAALAPTVELSGQNISDWLYLDQLYSLGLKEFSDAVAGKPYGFDSSPENRNLSIGLLNFSHVIGLRDVMEKHGDTQTALWLSSWGWHHTPENWQGDPSLWQTVSQSQQVDYTLTALNRIEREWTWSGGAILNEWKPMRPPTDASWGFSLLNPDNTPTPLLTALINRTETNLPRNGLFPAQNLGAEYSGVWSFSDLGADIGWLETSDSRVRFQFYGSEVALLLREGDYVAFLYPTIEGQIINQTHTDSSGNPYIFLKSDTELPEINLNPIANQLPLSEHILNLVADRGWDQWALVGFAVSDGDLSTPYQNTFTISVLVSIVATLNLIVTLVLSISQKNIKQAQTILRFISTPILLIFGIIVTIIVTLSAFLVFREATPNILKQEVSQFGIAIILTGGLVAFDLPFVVLVIACAILFILILNRPIIGLCLIIGWSPFFLFPVELYRFAFPIAELLLIITFATWIINQLIDYRIHKVAFKIHLHPLDYGVIAWMILGVIALFWSQYRSSALTELRTLIIEPSIFYLMIRTYKQGSHPVSLSFYLVHALLVSGIVVSVIGLAYFVQGKAIITAEDGTMRLASVYGSPNNVALLIGRCLPFGLAFALLQTNLLWRSFYGFSIFIMAIALVLTQSTGALIIGVPVSLVFVIFLVFGRKALLPVSGLVSLGLIGVAILTQVSARFAKLLSLDEGTNFLRIRVWESALDIIRQHPITGLGLDQFLYVFRGGYVKPDAIFDMELSHPHNVIFDFWIRLGVFGVITLLWLQFHFWRITYKLYRSTSLSTIDRIIVIGAMGCMVNLVSHGLVDNSVFVLDLSFIFMMLLGIVLSLSNRNPIDELQK